jgi:hypothetical protein
LIDSSCVLFTKLCTCKTYAADLCTNNLFCAPYCTCAKHIRLVCAPIICFVHKIVNCRTQVVFCAPHCACAKHLLPICSQLICFVHHIVHVQNILENDLCTTYKILFTNVPCSYSHFTQVIWVATGASREVFSPLQAFQRTTRITGTSQRVIG